MKARIRTKGIVLHEMAVKDNDKRIILFTKEAGKATVFARGARKPGSPFLASTQLMAYGEFDLVEGRSAYTLASSELVHAFHPLRSDMEKLALAMYFLEFADYAVQEGEPDPPLLLLLLRALSALEKGRMPARLVRRVFELKAMAAMGLSPWLDNCLVCRELAGGMVFSVREGGLLCKAHASRDASAAKLGETALYAMQYIQLTPADKVFSFTLDEEALLQVERAMDAFCGKMLSRQFKTLEFLKGFL